MEGKSSSNHSVDSQSSDMRGIPTSKKYGKKRFHLFQIVKTYPNGTDNYPEEWIITDLRNGLTLSDADFEWEKSYTEQEIDPSELHPEYSKIGVPVYGY